MAGTGHHIEIVGLKQTLRDLSRLGKDANQAMRDKSGEVAEDEAERLRAAGASDDRQSQLVAAVIRVKRDRVPAILAGGAKKLSPSGKKYYRSSKVGKWVESKKTGEKTWRGKIVKPSAGAIFFGAEFGGQRRKTTQQFRPWKGKQGYWFYPQLRKDEAHMVEQFAQAVDDVLDEFGG